MAGTNHSKTKTCLATVLEENPLHDPPSFLAFRSAGSTVVTTAVPYTKRETIFKKKQEIRPSQKKLITTNNPFSLSLSLHHVFSFFIAHQYPSVGWVGGRSDSDSEL